MTVRIINQDCMIAMSKMKDKKRVGCTCNKLPLGLCFMHPSKIKRRSKSRAHSGRGIR
jgi:hypothetical protein